MHFTMTRLSSADLNELASFCELNAAQDSVSATQAVDDNLAWSFRAQAEKFSRYAAGLRGLTEAKKRKKGR